MKCSNVVTCVQVNPATHQFCAAEVTTPFGSIRHSITNTMRIHISLLLLLAFILHKGQSFSPDLCTKMCTLSTTLCWLCTSVHGIEQDEPDHQEIISLEEQLRPFTKAELIRKAKTSYSRQQKIVGGMPVEQGGSPWTVR
jgi:hypothetical protein